MTGGRVVVLGPTGRNFAAGMSGGVAYVLDADGKFSTRCNREMVRLSRLEDAEEIARVKAMIQEHVAWTHSAHAQRILDRFADAVKQLVRVMPNDYERVVEAQARMRAKGLPPEEAEMAAFEANAHDQARAGGN
jgi:glutamate synthase (ferredoxin)